MSNAQTYTPTPVRISDRAMQKLRELLAEEGNPALSFRVYVTGGGCSGFQYGFSFDETFADDDTRVEREGVTVLVDPVSFPYITGSLLDYDEGLEGARFTVKNPNAATTCGCGASFSV